MSADIVSGFAMPLLVKLTLVFGALLLGRLALRRFAAAARHRLLVHGMALALLLPLLVGMLPQWTLPLAAVERLRVQPTSSPVPPEATSRERWIASAAPVIDLEAVEWPAATRHRPATPAGGSLSANRPAGQQGGIAVNWLPWIWLLGVLALGARFAVGWRKMGRLVTRSAPLEDVRVWRALAAARTQVGLSGWPAVVTSEAITIPATWGVFQPTLLLPADIGAWSDARLRMALLHELAHIRRRDGVALIVGRLVTALYWFHPLAWWVDHHAREDSEGACDDLVLASGTRASDYAELLLQIAKLPRFSGAAVNAMASIRPGGIETRLRAILCPRQRRFVGRLSSAFLVATTVAVVLGLASATVGATPEPVSGSGDVVREPFREPTVAQAEAREPEILLVHDSQKHSDGKAEYTRGMKQHRAERFEEAIVSFERALELGFNPDGTAYNIACGHARLGRTDQAIEWLERALEQGFDAERYLLEDSDLDSIRDDERFRRMLEEASAGSLRPDRRDQALEAYATLQQENSTDGRDWYRVGSALLSLRELNSAVDALEHARRLLAPANANALYNLACAHALAGDRAQALDSLKRAVLAGFDSDERFRNDSDLDALRKDPAFEEIAQLHADLSFEDDDDGWLGRIGSRGRWNRQVKHFREFTEQHPEIGRGWFQLGYALHSDEQHAEARAAFERAIELDFRPATSSYNVACTYAREGATEQAFDWLDRAVDAGFSSLGRMLHDDDLRSLWDEPRFEQLLERAIEMNPDYPQHDWRRQRDRRRSQSERGWI